jgi:hypothetical protein
VDDTAEGVRAASDFLLPNVLVSRVSRLAPYFDAYSNGPTAMYRPE